MFILPTRGRPGGLSRFVMGYVETHARSQVMVYLDKDDPCLPEYLDLKLPPAFLVLAGERRRIGPTLNFIFEKFGREPFYGILADDVVPRTDYWDRVLIQAAGRDGIAYPDDTIHHETLCTHPVIGGDLARSWGFLSYPGMRHLFMDCVWMRIGEAMERLHYCGHVVYEHFHFSNGKAERDRTYRDKDEFKTIDRGLYQQFIEDPAILGNILNKTKESLHGYNGEESQTHECGGSHNGKNVGLHL